MPELHGGKEGGDGVVRISFHEQKQAISRLKFHAWEKLFSRFSFRLQERNHLSFFDRLKRALPLCECGLVVSFSY